MLEERKAFKRQVTPCSPTYATARTHARVQTTGAERTGILVLAFHRTRMHEFACQGALQSAWHSEFTGKTPLTADAESCG